MRGTELSVSQIEGFCAGKGNTRADAAKRNVFSTQSLDLYWISSECAGVIKKVTTSVFLLVPADDIPTNEVEMGSNTDSITDGVTTAVAVAVIPSRLTSHMYSWDGTIPATTMRTPNTDEFEELTSMCNAEDIIVG